MPHSADYHYICKNPLMKGLSLAGRSGCLSTGRGNSSLELSVTQVSLVDIYLEIKKLREIKEIKTFEFLYQIVFFALNKTYRL